MGKVTLRKRVLLFILLPIIAGSVATALVAIMPIFIQYPTWIDEIMADLVNEQGSVLMQVSALVARRSSGFLQIPINYVVAMGNLMENYYTKALVMKSNLPWDKNDTLLSDFTINAVVMAKEGNTTVDMTKSMWYLTPENTNVSTLEEAVKTELAHCIDFDSFMLPIISTVEHGKRITEFFYVFNDTGLYYSSPARGYSLFNQTGPQALDPRNRPWFLDVKNVSEQFVARVTDPYYQLENEQIGQDTCFGVWVEDALKLALCLGINQNSLDTSLANLTVAEKSYGFVLNNDENVTVFSHPLYQRRQETPQNITMLEFGSSDSPEAVDFIRNIQPYFRYGNRALAKYMKNGEKWLIAISPVDVDMGTNGLFRRDLSAAIVMPESVLWDRVNMLKSESNEILIIESVVLFAIVVAMIVVGWL
jgi:hypothetical protein